MSLNDRIVWCRYHFKKDPLKDECRLGLNPRENVGSAPGGFYRLPCHNKPYENKATCHKCDLFTEEEIAAQDAERKAWIKAAVERMNATAPLVSKIKAAHRDKSATGTDVCPICGKTVRWSHAGYNNHISIMCETEDCIRFME